MFGIGSSELIVILLVALIVLGPKSLAGIARSLGKAMGEFRRISTDFQRTLNVEMAQEEEAERKKRLAAENTAKSQENSPTDRDADNLEMTQDGENAPPPKTTMPEHDLPPESQLADAVARTSSEAAAAESVKTVQK